MTYSKLVANKTDTLLSNEVKNLLNFIAKQTSNNHQVELAKNTQLGDFGIYGFLLLDQLNQVFFVAW